MTATESPNITKKKTLSPIWILPTLALLLTVWLMVNYAQERGSVIEVYFPEANGIEANVTPIRYQGVVVGKVNAVRLAEDNGGVIVEAQMNKMVDKLLKENTKFWLVSPKASLTGIDGLDALFSGNYITMRPGDGEKALEFIGSFETPVFADSDDSLIVNLMAERRGSLDIGSGIYFQQMQIGQVLKYELDPDTRLIRFTAAISPQYRSLVRKNSRFWNISGMSISAGIKSVDVKLESLASLIGGGIAMSSPLTSAACETGDEYVLYNEPEDAEPIFQITFETSDAKGLSVGTAIQHRGLQLGEITSMVMTSQGVELEAKVKSEYRSLFNEQSVFWRVGAQLGLNGVSDLDTLIFGDYIAVMPGDGEISNVFELAASRPAALGKGRSFQLWQKDAEGLALGAPLLYRGVPVGEVIDMTLVEDGVAIEAWLPAPYDTFVGTNSKFWRHSGVKVEADLSGLKLQTEPLTSLLLGGIAFSADKDNPAKPNSRFALWQTKAQAMEPKAVTFTLVGQQLSGLGDGAPIYFQELEVGKVVARRYQNHQFAVDVHVDGRYKSLLKQGTRFWHQSNLKVEGSLSGVKLDVAPVGKLLRGGLAFGHMGASPEGLPQDRNIYDDQRQALEPGVPITLFVPTTAKINAGADIRYRGRVVGEVESIALDEELQHLLVNATLDSSYKAHFLAEDSRYYVVSSKVNLNGVKHLETLVTGDYIAVIPGKSDRSVMRFNVSSDAPSLSPYDDGIKLVLNQARLGSLQVGSPVLYRQLKVGEVTHTQLAEDAASVDIEIQLAPQYQHLVNTTTRFWNASGLRADFGLFSGAKISTESIETLLAGGIAFATELITDGSNRVRPGHRFVLAPEADVAWLNWYPKF